MMTPNPIYLERHDRPRNMARFYALTLETDLLGDILVIRRWGRIGAKGRQITLPYHSEAAAVLAIGKLEYAKRKRGYRDRL